MPLDMQWVMEHGGTLPYHTLFRSARGVSGRCQGRNRFSRRFALSHVLRRQPDRDGAKGFCEKFVESDADAQILIKPVDNPSSFGIATLDETGRVIALEEKPKNPQSNQAIVGVYLFSPEIHRSSRGSNPPGAASTR